MFTHSAASISILFVLTLGASMALKSNNHDFSIESFPPTNKDTFHTIGEKFGGGIVFYITDSGRHGLIAATEDVKTRLSWSNGVYKSVETDDGLYAGVKNTVRIMSAQENDKPYSNFAAKVCADYSAEMGGITYNDWYLPSRQELNFLFLHFPTVGGFNDYHYWSSTEASSNYAWLVNFRDGSAAEVIKSESHSVRPIRKF